MCLLTYQKDPIILEEGKTVWKILRIRENIIMSIFQDFTWDLNRLYKTEIEISTDEDAYDGIQFDLYKIPSYKTISGDSCLKPGVIAYGKGFHSFNDYNYAHKQILRNLDEKVFGCLIPKGSEYYEDETGLCVSNQIIILKQL